MLGQQEEGCLLCLGNDLLPKYFVIRRAFLNVVKEYARGDTEEIPEKCA